MDLQNPDEFKKFIKLCREQGVVSVKSGDFEMKLSDQALFPKSPYQKKKESQLADAPVKTLADEAALYWSSIGISEEVQ